MATESLDCTGLSCPIPIVKISKAVKDLDVGDTLEVTATDPAFKVDIGAWARKTGHTIESLENNDGTWVVIIKVEDD